MASLSPDWFLTVVNAQLAQFAPTGGPLCSTSTPPVEAFAEVAVVLWDGMIARDLGKWRDAWASAVMAAGEADPRTPWDPQQVMRRADQVLRAFKSRFHAA